MATLRAKLTADEHAKLAEPIKEFYAAGDDGDYILDTDLRGDVSRLSGALEKERKEGKATKTRLEELAAKYKDIDPEKYNEAVEKLAALEGEKGKNANEWESQRQQMVDKHNKELEAVRGTITGKDTEIGELTRRLHDNFFAATANEAIGAEKGVPQLLLPHLRQFVKITEDPETKELGYEVVDQKGDRRVDGKGVPLTMRGLLSELKTSDVFGRAFEGSGASGSGTPGNRQSQNISGRNIVLTREQAHDPNTYRRAKAEAAKTGGDVVTLDQ